MLHRVKELRIWEMRRLRMERGVNEAEAEIDPVKYLPPIIISVKIDICLFWGDEYRRKMLFVQ